MTTKNYGKHIWRGGEKITVEKEDEVITVTIRSAQELERIKNLSGVKKVRHVNQSIHKITVEPQSRDDVMKVIRSEELSGVCHHAYRPKDSDNTRYYMTDEIVVKFKPELNHYEIEKLLTTKKLKIIKQYVGQEKTYLLQVTADTGENPIKVAERLVDEGLVVYAEPNLVNRFAGFYEPQDTYFTHQWHLKSSVAADVAENADISATEAWDITLGTRKIVLAVIDDGFDLRHPDFNGDGKIKFPKDFVDGDASPFPDKFEGNYHGTPCAGVAIAEENGYGVVGVAPRCAFMPVRFPMAANDDLLLEIFDYVGRRADVISCSWGPPPVYSILPQLLKDKFHQLSKSGGPRGKGCLIVFAAGNHNAPVNAPDNRSFSWRDHRGAYKDTYGPIVNGFATHPDVMAVAASTSFNKKALYSNWGGEISVCAPSDNFDPQNPNSSFVSGRGIWTTDNEQYGHDFTPRSQFTGRFGGTSSAAPLVAGVAALVFSANQNLMASQVKDIIQSTADEIFDDHAPTNWCGHGKVNAYKAVTAARDENGVQPEEWNRPQPQRVVNRSLTPNLAIPDNTPPGVESIIEIQEDGVIADIRVSLNISHTYIGDLVVRLISPSGKAIILHNNTGGDVHNILQSYDTNSNAALRTFINETTHGNWMLTVEDRASSDIGTLNSWGLELFLK